MAAVKFDVFVFERGNAMYLIPLNLLQITETVIIFALQKNH